MYYIEGLFPLTQLLVPFVSQFRELLGLGEEFLGFFREGLQQAVVTNLAHDELLEVSPVGFFACYQGHLIILSNLFFHFFPMWHLIGQQRIKLFGVILMYQMTKFMGNDVFNWSCIVNVLSQRGQIF